MPFCKNIFLNLKLFIMCGGKSHHVDDAGKQRLTLSFVTCANLNQLAITGVELALEVQARNLCNDGESPNYCCLQIISCKRDSPAKSMISMKESIGAVEQDDHSF
jgi:hypothetical protein